MSRWAHCEMTNFELKSMQPPAAPQWQGEPSRGDITVMVTVQPVGWLGDWHENPKPQWIVPLSGRWFVEAMDGVRHEFGPGEFSFGGDQNCRAARGTARATSPARWATNPRCSWSSSSTTPPQRPRSRSRPEHGRPICSWTTTPSKRWIPASARLTLDNAPLEKLDEGFRLVGGAGLDGGLERVAVSGFAERPHDDLARRSSGADVWRQPSHFANGQARDRQGRLAELFAPNACDSAHRI